MVIEYADRNRVNNGALLSYRKAMIRAECKEIERLAEELKELQRANEKAARRPPSVPDSRF